MMRRNRLKKKRKGFWFDVIDFFIFIGECLYYLFKLIFKIFD